MRIYSMTATFGKLEHETLTVQPGLNIIHAPNEWGKSTWCAFLVAMFYGIETRVHSTKAALADKERYAPWSGSPMSGRIDLNWNGRDITIERRTKGRAIFGDFKAYETESGITVPELTATNCGQMLLGVEKSVFTRSAFLRLTDLPVTQDETLRRRLNSLVTTGHESGTADVLAQKLKDLKNKVRFNRTGLLPQAEHQKAQLEEKLRELDSLHSQVMQIQTRQASLEARIAGLENHRDALAFQVAQEHDRKVAEAQATEENTATQLRSLEQECAPLPSKEEARQQLTRFQSIHRQIMDIQEQLQSLPMPPEPPAPPPVFAGKTPEEALAMAQRDTEHYQQCNRAARNWVTLLPGLLLGVLGCILLFTDLPLWAILPLGASFVYLLLALRKITCGRNQAVAFFTKYDHTEPAQWQQTAKEYQAQMQSYQNRLQQQQTLRLELEQKREDAKARLQELLQGQPFSGFQQAMQDTIAKQDALEIARREYDRAAAHTKALEDLRRPAQPPKAQDTLTCSPAETERQLADCGYELRQLQLRLGQCQGQMETLGSQEQLRKELESLRERIDRLNDTYAALIIAQASLNDAATQLQRRFAPRIAARAQTLFAMLTDDRYDRLTLGEDLSLYAGAQGEDTIRSALWRSDGTVDQLYLALRLAVSEALTPNAPLILDDALVRFDDTRLKVAMEILKSMAEDKQILLFTCQTRELQYQ